MSAARQSNNPGPIPKSEKRKFTLPIRVEEQNRVYLRAEGRHGQAISWNFYRACQTACIDRARPWLSYGEAEAIFNRESNKPVGRKTVLKYVGWCEDAKVMLRGTMRQPGARNAEGVIHLPTLEEQMPQGCLLIYQREKKARAAANSKAYRARQKALPPPKKVLTHRSAKPVECSQPADTGISKNASSLTPFIEDSSTKNLLEEKREKSVSSGDAAAEPREAEARPSGGIVAQKNAIGGQGEAAKRWLASPFAAFVSPELAAKMSAEVVEDEPQAPSEPQQVPEPRSKPERGLTPVPAPHTPQGQPVPYPAPTPAPTQMMVSPAMHHATPVQHQTRIVYPGSPMMVQIAPAPAPANPEAD